MDNILQRKTFTNRDVTCITDATSQYNPSHRRNKIRSFFGDGFGFSTRDMFWISFVVRFTSIFMVQTYFVPDEYWQSLEVAHYQTFGYGYLTWEWKKAIRGYLYPAVFGFLFKLLETFGIDNASTLTLFPRLAQALLMVFTDMHTYHLANNLYGWKSAQYTFLCQVTSWFLFYTGSRTLSNTTEMCLTTIGLFYITSGLNQSICWKSIHLGLFLGILSYLIRPTAAITWILVLFHFIAVLWNRPKLLLLVFLSGALVSSFTLSLSIITDFLFYKQLVIPTWNFIHFNVVKNLNAFYGSHPWHWYIIQGIPVTTGIKFIPMLIGLWNPRGKCLHVVIIAVQIMVLSCISHKEFRFLLPILPLCFCLAGHGLSVVSNWLCSRDKSILGFRVKGFQMLILISIIWNAFIGLYTGLIHQRGPIDSIKYVARLAENLDNVSVLFLMPCHSTPYYSHVHKNITMRFLGCNPPFQEGENEEAEIFYSFPLKWLMKEYGPETEYQMPTVIMFFNTLLKDISSFLSNFEYRECERFFHTHFPSERRGSHIVAYCKYA